MVSEYRPIKLDRVHSKFYSSGKKRNIQYKVTTAVINIELSTKPEIMTLIIMIIEVIIVINII